MAPAEFSGLYKGLRPELHAGSSFLIYCTASVISGARQASLFLSFSRYHSTTTLR